MVASRAISKNTTWIIVVDAWRLAYPLAWPTAAARYIIARRQSYLSADSEPAQRVTRGLARFGRCESLSHLKITQRNCDFRNSSPSQVYIYCSARFLEPRNRKWFTTDSTAHFGSSSFSSPSVLKIARLKYSSARITVQVSSDNAACSTLEVTYVICRGLHCILYIPRRRQSNLQSHQHSMKDIFLSLIEVSRPARCPPALCCA